MPRTSVRDRTQIVPFAGASDFHFRLARSFALVTDWAAALAGRYPIDEVITVLTRQIGAANVALYRLEGDRALAIATAARAHDTRTAEVSSGAMARFIRGFPPRDLEPGAIWRLSQLRAMPGFAGSALARESDGRCGIVEVSLIVLEAMDGHIDCLEAQFDRRPDRSPELPTSIITQAMANAWAARLPGLVLRQIKAHGRTRGAAPDGAAHDILGPMNPCALSRAEQRVGQLVVTGAKARDVAEALGISVPTVRSHLRNLYAKTGTASQVELIALVRDADRDAA